MKGAAWYEKRNARERRLRSLLESALEGSSVRWEGVNIVRYSPRLWIVRPNWRTVIEIKGGANVIPQVIAEVEAHRIAG